MLHKTRNTMDQTCLGEQTDDCRAQLCKVAVAPPSLVFSAMTASTLSLSLYFFSSHALFFQPMMLLSSCVSSFWMLCSRTNSFSS